MISIQKLTKFDTAPTNGTVDASHGTTLIRGGRTEILTDSSRSGKTGLFSMWDCELHLGVLDLPPLDGYNERVGPLELRSGQLYIRSVSRLIPGQVSPQPPSHHAAKCDSDHPIASSVPVVVKIGTVQAGSVGTHWFIMKDNNNPPKTWIALLGHPDEKLGSIMVQDVDHLGEVNAPIKNEDEYLELPNHRLVRTNTQPMSVSSNSVLMDLVAKAKSRCVWQH